jgi:hypothetical protein
MFQRDFIDRQGPQRRGKNLEGLAPLRAVLRIAPLGFFGSNQLERSFAERLAAILCPPGSPASLNRIGVPAATSFRAAAAFSRASARPTTG